MSGSSSAAGSDDAGRAGSPGAPTRMGIGELARRTGVSERSLRYYEQQGLLAAERTPGGQRRYPERAVHRVIRVQELFAAGLCSAKIVELLPCIRDEDGGPSEVATPTLLAELAVERARLGRMIARLEASREVLDQVMEAAAGADAPPGGAENGSGRPGERAA